MGSFGKIWALPVSSRNILSFNTVLPFPQGCKPLRLCPTCISTIMRSLVLVRQPTYPAYSSVTRHLVSGETACVLYHAGCQTQQLVNLEQITAVR